MERDEDLMNPCLLQLLKELIILELKRKHRIELRRGGFEKIAEVVSRHERTLSPSGLERYVFTNGLTQSFVHEENIREGLVLFLQDSFGFKDFVDFKTQFSKQDTVKKYEKTLYNTYCLRSDFSFDERTEFDAWAKEKCEELFAKLKIEQTEESSINSMPREHQIDMHEAIDSYIKNDKHIYGIFDRFKINNLIKRTKELWTVEENIDKYEIEDLVKLIDERLFTYNYNSIDAWIENEPKLPLIKEVIDEAIVCGNLTKALFNVIINYGWMVEHKNLVNPARIKFIEAEEVLKGIKHTLQNDEYIHAEDKIKHFNMQVYPYSFMHEDQHKYCSQFIDNVIKPFSHYKCIACVFVKQKVWNEAERYIQECSEMIKDLDKNASVFDYVNDKKILKKSYVYSLAYFYRVATEFYLSRNSSNINIAFQYAKKSLKYLDELGFQNSPDTAINYYHLYKIHHILGNKKEESIYYERARSSRKDSPLMRSCLIDIQELDKNLRINLHKI